MSSDVSFHLSDEMDSILKVADDGLKQMKRCCAPEIPFHVASEMESTIDVVNDCLEQMKKCLELARTFARLESYEKEGSKTKVMLILTPHGSKEKFKALVVRAIATYAAGLGKLSNCIAEVQAMAKKKNLECSQCQGTGTRFKWVYVRERGSPTQPVYRSFQCDGCSGTGQVAVDSAVREPLNVFREKASKLFATMENFHASLQDFTTGSSSRTELAKKPKSPERPEEITHAQKQEDVITTVHEKLKPKKPLEAYSKEYFLRLLNLNRKTSYYSRASSGTATWWERRANRQYTCSACKKLIRKGDRYIGCRKLEPGMRGPYGYKGTYFQEYYHIVCLLKDEEGRLEGNIRNLDFEKNRLASEITSLRNEIQSRRQQIKDCETSRQKARKDYEDTSFWRKFDKWVGYKYTSRSKRIETSRLEGEISEIERREIPQREARITDSSKRVSSLERRLRKIKDRIQELTRPT